jgi:hypothetical protein
MTADSPCLSAKILNNQSRKESRPMTYRYHYTIILKVRRDGLLTLPIADFHVEGTLDPDRDFARQIADVHSRYLASIRPKLKKARKG